MTSDRALKNRYIVFLSLLFLALLGLVVRLINLTLFEKNFLRGQGDARSIRNIQIPAYRGMIVDRNNQPLAVSTAVQAVWFDPQIAIQDKHLQQLAKLLETPWQHLKQRITTANDREFVYLKRGIAPDVAERIRKLDIPGLYTQREFRRFYPEGEVTAHLLGYTNIDDQGQEGLELAYNNWLSGSVGKKRVLKDRLGRIVAELNTIQQAHPGHDLALSIDRRLQYMAYRELKDAVLAHQATHGSLIALDAKTGAVLAIANYPSFNPNKRHKQHHADYRNRAITDMFEPGSALKAFSVTSALESGQYKPSTPIQTYPGWMVVDGNMIQDVRNYGKLSVAEVLQHSSNIGVTKMILASPAEHLIGLLERVGFGQLTESRFPGESPGIVNAKARWQDFVLATLAFGHGVSVTALQLAQAYTIFANDGKLLPVSLLQTQEVTEDKQVISKEVAKQMLDILEKVVTEGTASRAKVSGYRVAGKTGTARVVTSKGYAKDRHIASFVGIAPVSNPRLVIAVIIHEPKAGQYYGSLVAAPVFAKVMASALRILEVAPDNLAVTPSSRKST